MSLLDEDSEEKQINSHVINCAFFCSYDRVGRTNLRRTTVLVGAINKGTSQQRCLVISLPALNPAPLLIGFKKPIIMQGVSGNKLHREKLAFKSSELARNAT